MEYIVENMREKLFNLTIQLFFVFKHSRKCVHFKLQTFRLFFTYLSDIVSKLLDKSEWSWNYVKRQLVFRKTALCIGET